MNIRDFLEDTSISLFSPELGSKIIFGIAFSFPGRPPPNLEVAMANLLVYEMGWKRREVSSHSEKLVSFPEFFMEFGVIDRFRVSTQRSLMVASLNGLKAVPSLLILDFISLTDVSNRFILSAWRAIKPAALGDMSKLSKNAD